MSHEVKLSKRKLKSLIRDEKMASKEYRSYGFKSLAKDEAKHKRFLEKKLKDGSKFDVEREEKRKGYVY